jgi:Glycosyl transferase family 2
MVRLSKPSRRASLKRKVSRGLDTRKDRVTRKIGRWRVHLSVKHLHGPERIAYAPDELVVVCLVRNGRPYIKSFIDHYLSLGVKHIVFLDNGSDDDTVAVARNHERVTVMQTKLPYQKYEYQMTEYLIARFGKGRWILYADIDELFDYPYSDVVGLSSLLRYLNERSYTAVVAQMLDMFPDEGLSSRLGQKDEPLKELYRFYDLSNIERKDYARRRSNVIGNHEIKRYKGGIRNTVFDAPFTLTKHPLVVFNSKLKHTHGGLHGIKNARIADFSCVLYHYKLVNGLREQVARAVSDERYSTYASWYKRYHEVLEREPSIRIRQDSARELGSVNELIDNGFLVVSDEYKRWADAEKNTSASS